MGDRAMAEIKVTDGSLFFYTHYGGYDLPKYAREALKKAQTRIGDDSYALKIVVDSLIKSSGARDAVTGAGLMLGPNAEDEYYPGEHHVPSVVIDLVENKVTVIREENWEEAMA